ncbi:penicillin acylase family protein [Emticicia sp. 21SJ11W-3]|uniref:penicillin acylase family protein n=1 Tax=Emticicia sp. 21SJ11W-3 TaxID=2916755 RepID=UPI00209E60CD|nr:penicillin acylase family protein [Emticicia sp. 21SJ11W-3]UTA69234.1 penicillin acylase family protein [Emticicia sp. 21SJ11W-3]
MKVLKKILVALLIIIVVAGVGIYIWLSTFKPNLNTELQLKGLKDKVEVIYDNYGVPHIYAQNEEDLFYAFGYVHAQDRLFQMELIRRLADGRLAELFGEKAVASDKFFRTLGLRKHAQWTIDSLVRKNPDAPFVKAAEAYVKGINQYMAQGKAPLEFTLAGISNTPFTLEDCYIISGYMGFTFAEAFRAEAIATYIHNKFGDTYLNDVWSQWPKGEPVIPVQQKDSAAKVAQTLASIANQLATIETTAPFPPYHGSNGWVISGSKTKSGKPILSNDTHIAFAQPSVWYEAHLECPGFHFYGNFLAGTPFAALGHNQNGGWGLTMFENDDVDFFRERLNPQNPNQVWYKDHWENLNTYQESIKVKGVQDIKITIKRSRHGTLMNDSFDKMAKEKDPIALWWVFNQFPSHLLQNFYDLAHARNAGEASKAVSTLAAPGLNFMWADTAGNIAWWAAGKLPRRPAHVNPMLILDGTTGKDDPLGWLDFSQNPQILNPARGVLYTANNQPADMGTGPVPGYYVPGNRAKRIEQLLFTDKKDWTPEEVRKVINDVTSTSYKSLLKDIIPIIFAENLSPLAKKSIEKLIPWDGAHQLNNVEPTIFYRFIYYMLVNTVKDELGQEVFASFEHNVNFKRNMIAMIKKEDSPWWDNVNTPERETRRQILTKSINDAAASLEKQLGGDIEKWQWEKVHTLTHKHPLGILPVVGKFFNVGPFPAPGGRETINNLDFQMDSTGVYDISYGPALRRIIDFGYPDKGTSILPTGQSGNIMSKHYSDQAKMYVNGEARPELMNRTAIEKVQTGKILFKP